METDAKNAGDLTTLLQEYARGNQEAIRLLIERVYNELRTIAAGQLRSENRNPFMGPTALVNEAFIRLVGNKFPAEWANRRHFFAAASETMRRILVDQARHRLALKRSRTTIHSSPHDIEIPIDVPDEELIDIDTACKEFARIDPDKAELVKLRFFVGLTEVEAAQTLGISRATAARHWAYSKAWLFDWLKTNGD